MQCICSSRVQIIGSLLGKIAHSSDKMQPRVGAVDGNLLAGCAGIVVGWSSTSDPFGSKRCRCAGQMISMQERIQFAFRDDCKRQQL
jgi:hypothetical protein